MPSNTLRLIKAAERADFGQVASLLRDGAPVNGSGKDGTSALHAAVSGLGFVAKRVAKGRLVRCRAVPLPAVYKTVRLLLKAGADPNALNEYGTPLLFAAGEGNLPVVRMLIEAGALANQQNDGGFSPLARAVRCGRTEVVAYLLEHGADPRLKDVEGKSVLDKARLVLGRGPEYRPIYEMVKAANAKLSKSARTRPAVGDLGHEENEQNQRLALTPALSPRRGRIAARLISNLSHRFSNAPGALKLGVKDFAGMQGHAEWSLFAVKAPAAAVAKALAHFRKPTRLEKQVQLKAAQKSEQVARLTAVLQIKSNLWAVVLRSVFVVSAQELEGVPAEAKALSAKLKTRAVTFLFEDTSNAMGCAVYERGRLLEEAVWECGGAMTSFSSKLRKPPEGKRYTEDFADQLFRDEGIYVPACYPRSEGARVWLAVQTPSAGLIERAMLLEIGKIPTPTFDRATARIRARARGRRAGE